MAMINRKTMAVMIRCKSRVEFVINNGKIDDDDVDDDIKKLKIIIKEMLS